MYIKKQNTPEEQLLQINRKKIISLFVMPDAGSFASSVQDKLSGCVGEQVFI